MNNLTFITSESVTEGHPDKFCDYLSDLILDNHLKQDKNARVACEVMASGNLIVVAGEVTSKATVDYKSLVKKAFKSVGYDYTDELNIIIKIDKQSPDISQGVSSGVDLKNNKTNSLGAGDQGIMFGFACDETKELMPLATVLANNLTKKMAEVRKNNPSSILKSDGKSQVTVCYKNNKPLYVDTIVLSSQHHNVNKAYKYVELELRNIIKEVVEENLLNKNTKILINPTGQFLVGGLEADTGLTGRKIIVDTYGGYARHGGGAFSGKDPTKIDRSGAYMARYVAKNLVATGLVSRCEVFLAYAIGVSEPVSISIDTFGAKIVDPQLLLLGVKNIFDFTPLGIIDHFKLKSQKYTPLSAYGHLGREDLNLPWEKKDRVENILSFIKNNK